MQIFDMDGTLIDSNGIWKDVDTAFLAKRGLSYTKEFYEGVAHTIFPLAAKFTKEFCRLPESEEAIMAEWMDMAGDLYGTSVPVKPGVRAYLDKLRAAGERLIVVTSAVPVHCRTALTHLGLMPYHLRPRPAAGEKGPPALASDRGDDGRRAGGLHAVRRLGGGLPGRQGRRDARRRGLRPLLRRHGAGDAGGVRPVYPLV